MRFIFTWPNSLAVGSGGQGMLSRARVASMEGVGGKEDSTSS